MLRIARYVAVAIVVLLFVFAPVTHSGLARTHAQGGAPNDIVQENSLPGTPPSQWDVQGAGDSSIQGFATSISVNRGTPVTFKIDTPATAYHLDIYRMGYYGGNGARLVATIQPSATLPQVQPDCFADTQTTGLVDCGNWDVSAAWTVPSTAVSGIYFAKAVRDDLPAGSPQEASHIVFIVRNDAGGSNLLFQTSDETWEAYNNYGGVSLYCGGPVATNPGVEYDCASRSVKVSYNRPFLTRGVGGGEDWVFNAEYPMVRFLEANGYDVSYIAGADVDAGVSGQNPLLLGHKVFLSVGHDEYWSGQQRANVEAARNAGVNLSFFSGNEMYWKTRWEDSVAGPAASHRTLVSYKSSLDGGTNTDPSGVWTGTWRDARSSPPADGGRPENAVTGTSFAVNDGAGGTAGMTVPQAMRALRFWRNTPVAGLSSGDANLPTGVLGYEWDEDPDNGARPAGLLHLSSTTLAVASRVLDAAGVIYGSGSATHNLTLYRAASPAPGTPGALVFGAGSVQWSWGLDAVHDRAGTPADLSMQQATVNLLADMGVQPGGPLLAGLTPATASTDTTPPTVTITGPAGTFAVATGRAIQITGTAVDAGGVVAGIDVSTDAGATWHHANGTTNWTFSWTPAEPGQAILEARATDDSGNLSTASTETVTVVTSDPNAGPGGPILLVTNAANPFTRYYAEILRNEGFNEFAVADLSSVTSQTLAGYEAVVLGQMALTAAQVDMFTQWTTAGGNLIAMRPDKQLYPLLGLTDAFPSGGAGSTLSNGYLLFNALAQPSAGLVGETIQFHGDADYAGLGQTQSLAMLYSNATTPTSYPAATVRAVGSAGGQAAAFLFDLARSVVYTRQGNPGWSGQERDGVSPIRSDDLFFGAKAGDVQPDWIDLNKVAIPQADEQQRLLGNLLLHLNVNHEPLPRFWYFPRGGKAVVVMTGDDHGNGGTAGRFDEYLNFSPPGCSVNDWQCVRSTSYLFAEPRDPLTDAQAAAYDAQGFEISLHGTTNCTDWSSAAGLANLYTTQLADLQSQYPSLPPMLTHRMHCVVWSDYDTQPQVELNQGMRLDTTYYYWPGSWTQNRPGMFTGSGMPMRFAKADGTLIDVYQAATQMTDESGQTYPFTIDSLLNNALGPQAYYGVFTANMHTDFNESDADGKNSMVNSNAIVASAQARGVPIVSARQMLQWLDGRNDSSFSLGAWDGTTLSFSVTAAAGANGLQAMLPIRSGRLKLTTLSRGASSVNYRTDTIKGVSYAFFDATTGGYQATYVIDDVPPAISQLTAVATGPDTAVVTWTTDEPSTSHVDFGTSTSPLQSGPTDTAYVTSHSVTLTGLTALTTYYHRVTSADGAIPANVAVSPAPTADPASFVTLPEPPPSFVDTTVADFSAGTPDANLYLAQTSDGEVILKPTVGEEFTAPALPPDWFVQPWATGGTATIAGGLVAVDAALLGQTGSYPPGRSLEFVATFNDAFEHAGFGTDFNAGPWAIFSSDGTQVYARTDDGTGDGCPTAGPRCTPLGSALFGTPHRFRIEWSANGVIYYVDGVEVASHAATMTTPMRPLAASDFNFGGGVLVDDWFRMSPYASSGVFLSHLFDAGVSTNNWGAASWTAQLPTGTGMVFSVRTGDSTNPDDGTWSPFRVIPASGGQIGGTSRYLQYRAVLSTTDSTRTPEIQEVRIQHDADPATLPVDTTPPVISQVSAAPGSATAVVTWTTDEAASSRVDFQPVGGVSSAVSDPELVLNHRIVISGLVPSTSYSYTVTSSDFSNNSTTSGAFVFTTAAPSFTDTLVADFAQGQTASTTITDAADGEVALGRVVANDFNGTSLPSDWAVTPWNTGDLQAGATVANGVLTLAGARAYTAASYQPGQSLEFVATFGAEAFEHVGFGTDTDFTGQWALFSTGATTNTLFARTSDGIDTPIPGSFIGSSHRYRIDWTTSSVVFWIDGAQVSTHTFSAAGPMFVIANDLTTSTPNLTVDSVGMTYKPSGTFVSRVFDGGQTQNWGTLSWTSTVPPSTALAFTVSTGDTPTPDASWTTTSVGTSGGAIGRASRYIQYQAVLTSSDPGGSPVIDDVTIVAAAPVVRPVANSQSVSTNDDAPLAITLTASEPGGGDQTLTYTIGTTPTHGTLSGTAPHVTYTPTAPFNGTDSFTFVARDVSGAVSDPATVTITVTHVNHAPVVTTPAAQSAAEGNAVTLPIAATDQDHDTLIYSATGLPQGLSINATTGVISGTIGFDAAASSPYTVVVTVTDNGTPSPLSGTATFTWTVANTNRAPNVTNPGTQTTTENTAVSLPIAATDPDGDALTYAATGLPLGLTINRSTGLISGTLSFDAQRSYTTTVTVTDNGSPSPLATSVTFTWNTINVNRPPTIATPSSQSNIEGATVDLTLTASDPDGDPLTYTATGLPNGLSITSTGHIVGTLALGSAGSYSVTVTVTDSSNASASTAPFAWIVSVATTTTLTSPTANPTTYGTPIVLNAAVASTSGSGIPTGTVEFFDGSTSLGTSTLSGGAASLTTSSISAGSPTIVTAVYHPTGTFLSSSGTLARTVNKASGTGSFITMNPLQLQYSDKVLMEATVSPSTATGTVTFENGSIVVAANVPIVNGKASINTPIFLSPGSKIITAVFNTPNYTVSNVTKSVSILKEDARVSYTGPTTINMNGASTVAITVNVSDITAIDPTSDPNPGNIGTATVAFVNRSTLATLGTVAVTANADPTTGTATYYFPASSISGSSTTITFGFVVGGNYTRNSSTDNVTITINK